MLRHGVPVHIISQRLGHASVSITLDVYAHAMPRDDELAADTMSQLLFEPDDTLREPVG